MIVAFPKREIAKKIKNIMIRNGFEVSAVCLTGSQVLRELENHETGVIVSGIRFVDMMYSDIKAELDHHFEMIVVASQNQWGEYGRDDVLCLSMPLRVYDLVDTVHDLMNEVDQRLKLEREKPQPRSQKEQSSINQAKRLLMDEEGFTEEGAHRYLQKHSMDTGDRMVDTAYMVLELFQKIRD